MSRANGSPRFDVAKNPKRANQFYRVYDLKTTKLRTHQFVLQGHTPHGVKVRLRPLTENDWALLDRWNNDPEVLYYSEGDDITSYSLDDLQDLYRTISQKAYCFIIEADGEAVGEGWLQQMNIERILQEHPGQDCHRIDLLIGKKSYWNQGIGTQVIRMLTDFGFNQIGARIIYEPEIADYNIRSLKAFQKVGYRAIKKIPYPPGGKAAHGYDLVLTRDEYLTLLKP